MADKNLNPMNQKVYDVSDNDSPLNYNQMLHLASNQYGKDPEAIADLMNRIAYHESAGTMNPAMQQYEGGPGRGLFQFEQRYRDKETGELGQAGGLTARNRLAQLYEQQGANIPDWLFQDRMQDPSVGFDASQLTKEQQGMLFLGNVLMGKGRTLEGMENTTDWWAKHHHIAGGRQDAFDDSMSAYDLKYKPTAEEMAFNY